MDKIKHPDMFPELRSKMKGKPFDPTQLKIALD